VVYNDLGRYKDAKKAYAEAKSSSKSTEAGQPDRFVKGKIANMHADVGTVYESIGMFDEAIEEFGKALALRPEFVDIRTKLANTLREQGELKLAIKELRQAKKDRPDYAPARIGLGLAYYSSGQIKDAIAEWKGVVAQDPDNARAQMYLRLVTDMEPSGKASKKASGKKATAKKKSTTKKSTSKKTAKKATRKSSKKTARAR
jgi:tetratricopeptide (TPR) repeat protein